MSIRNRLLLLLLAIALTPLVFTSLLQQASIWVMRGHLAKNTRDALEANARQNLQEQLQSDVEILELDRQLADVQLRRQVREVEQRLAGITPPPRRGPGERGPEPNVAGAPPRGMGSPNAPPMGGRSQPDAREVGARGRGGLRGGFPGGLGRGPGGGFGAPVEYDVVNTEFGLDPNLKISAELRHSYFDSAKTSTKPAAEPSGPSATSQTQSSVVSNSGTGPSEANAPALAVDYRAQSCLVARGEGEAIARGAMEKLADMTQVYRDICARGPGGILWLHTSLGVGLHLTYPGGAVPRDLSRYNPLFTSWYMQAQGAYMNERLPRPIGESRTLPADANSTRGPGRRGRGAANSPWERMIRERQIGIEVTQGILTWDRFTGQVVVIRSMPITYANGDFAGAAAMVRTIPEIFSSLQLPERWGADIERMLILVDPNADDVRQKVSVLLEDRRESTGREGPSPVPGTQPPPPSRRGSARRGGPMFGGPLPGGDEVLPRPLSIDPNDLPVLNAVIEDVAKDQAGVRQIEYKGRQCLLAYQPLDIPQAAAVLVVPYERIVSIATTWEQSLDTQSVRGLQVTTLVLLVVGVAAVSLAAVKARNLTRPINALIEAGTRLGNGDYNARVDIRTSDELEHLGRVFNETGPKLRDHERMKRSLELASAIQHSLLPVQTPQMQHFELAGRCVYCDETGGDYYDFIRVAGFQPACGEGVSPSLKDQSAPSRGQDAHETRGQDGRDTRLGLAIGDVSGHGIGAALLMAVTRGLLHAEAPHYADDLATLMMRLNRELVHDTAEETFVTLFYGILNDQQRSLIWASAGHEPATWYHAATGQIEELPNTGMLLGVLPTATFRQAGPVTLAPGDILVLGTDGIWEAHDGGGHFFGKDRLHRIVQDAAGLSAEDICDRIIDAVGEFIQPAAHSDDITLIVIKAKA